MGDITNGVSLSDVVQDDGTVRTTSMKTLSGLSQISI